MGIDNRQYALFQLKPEFINSYGAARFDYWLKAITDSMSFAYAVQTGDASRSGGASYFLGVRPRFLID